MKDQDSVSFIKEKSEEGEDWAVLRQVQINRSFYKGQQWISWDKIQKRVFVPELRPGEKRYTFNKIKPAVLTLLAKLCKNRVKLEVRPDTNDIKRIEMAKGGLKYLHYQWQRDEMDRKTRRLKMHMLIDGNPALMVYVDKTKGKDIPIPEDLELDEDMKLPTKSGEIVTIVCDQLSIKVDPSAEDITEIRWAMREYPEDVDVIMEEWGAEVEAEDNLTMRQSYEFSLGSEGQKKFKNMAMVRDYWELPCPKYPNGRRIVVAGDKELLKDENDPGEFPFIFFPAIPVPGRAVGDGVVSDLTTPQRSYNVKRTAEARILEEMGNPLWMVPTNSVPDQNDLVNAIGGVVEYTPIGGMKPDRAPGVEPGAGWQAAMERDEADIEDMSGAHEISQGATPRGNNTLGGLQLQLEQDETKLSLLVQSYEDGMKEWGSKVLRLIKRHFPEEQQLSIVGENGEIEAFTFNGAELEEIELSVDVVPGSSMPTLKAVHDQKVMEMWGAGMFTDPKTGMPDVRKVVRMLGESIANDYFDDTEQHENKALMENRLWQNAFGDPRVSAILSQYAMAVQQYQMQAQQVQMQGADPEMMGLQPPQPPMKLPVVRDFYDHQTHIEMHNRYRLTEEYDNLPPELQMLVDMHVQEHIDALNAPMIAEQQAMMAQQQADEEAKTQEADANHQRQVEMKQIDQQHQAQMQQMKGDAALMQASMRTAGRG
jgi:hypothetical protein